MRFPSLGGMLFGAVVGSGIPSFACADDGGSAPSASNVPKAAAPASGADAASAAAATSAKTLFERGRDLRARGDCAGALPFFQKAYSVYPLGLGSLRNIAVCQEALNHFASAKDSWLALKRAVAASNDSKYAGWGDDADRAVWRLGPKVAKLTLELTVVAPTGEAMSTDGVDVTVDGQPLPSERIGEAIEHDPGSFVVRAAGAHVDTPAQQNVDLAPGESKHVSLQVTVTPAPASPTAETTEPPAPVEPSSDGPPGASPMRTGAWVALGVGAAGLAGAAVTFAVRQSALSDLADTCPLYKTMPCDPSTRSTVNSDESRGRMASTLFSVFGAVGIVGTVTGFTLLLTNHFHHASTALVVTPNQVSAVGTF